MNLLIDKYLRIKTFVKEGFFITRFVIANTERDISWFGYMEEINKRSVSSGGH